MKTCQLVNFILILTFSLHIQAAESDAFSKKLNTLKTFQADFQQTVYDAQGRRLQTTTGEFSLQRPGQFRWETKKPFKQIIMASEQKVWLYDIELEQAIVKNAKQVLGETPAVLLIGTSDKLSEHFNIKELKAKKNHTWYLITPKQKDKASFRHARIGFTNDVLKEMRLVDSLDNRVQIHFLKPKSNLKLSDAVFHLKLPKNVDVIR